MENNLELLSTLSPYVRRALDGNMPPKWCLDERVIFDYELIYIMEGKGEFVIDEIIFDALPGDLFFLPPKISHTIKSSCEWGLRQPHVHFDMNYDSLSEKIYISFEPLGKIKKEDYVLFRNDPDILAVLQFPYKITLKERYSVEKMIFSLIETQNGKGEINFLKTKGLMLQLLARIYEDVHEHECHRFEETHLLYKDMKKIKEYIMYNYRSEITLDKLAAMANVSKNHLIRSFKEVYGVTPMQHYCSVRLDIAKHLIETSNNTISEICEYLGFSSVQYFSRVFKKHTQSSPSDYKNRYSKLTNSINIL